MTEFTEVKALTSLMAVTGVDTADYRYSLAAVNVSLVTNTGTGGDAQGDTLSGIENLTGSEFDDTLTGDNNVNRLVGGEGADHIYGGGGNDMILTGGGYDYVDGGAGVDTVSYENSWAGVIVNLATGDRTIRRSFARRPGECRESHRIGLR